LDARRRQEIPIRIWRNDEAHADAGKVLRPFTGLMRGALFFRFSNNLRENNRTRRSDMFQFVASLFGCGHHRCTFPITAKKPAAAPLKCKPSPKTYIVCLDCGKEFAYDWQKMRRVAAPKAA